MTEFWESSFSLKGMLITYWYQVLFEKYGLIEFLEIDEPSKNKENKPPIKFTIVKCKKEL
jgi:hypothetical protein